MNRSYRNLGLFFVAVYIFGVLWIGYYSITDLQKLTKIFETSTLLVYMVVGMGLVGLLAFLFLYLGANNRIDVMYVTGSENKLGEKNGLSPDEDFIDLTSNTTLAVVNNIKSHIKDTQADRKKLLEQVLRDICNFLEASLGALYVAKYTEEEKNLIMSAGYALIRSDSQIPTYKVGEGLVGQVAKNGKPIRLDAIPEGYVKVVSGLGTASPRNILLAPIKNNEGEVLGVLELASFKIFNDKDLAFLQEVALLLARELEADEFYDVNV
ncbi:MAG: GAF domain-containing protein [Microscillaceae bacterium]|jgi:putative methionine-R-sulfoxide reductase with GAF domain|nr:GAF domain-containing protein [Microscillaceae bacterium]